MSNPTELPDLLPCPFCGSTKIFTEPDEYGSGGQWVMPIHVGCSDCGAEQQCEDIDDVPKVWNRRAALASRPAEVDDEGLPVMPDPAGTIPMYVDDAEGTQTHEVDGYTAEQYRQGQRDAVAADRARSGEQAKVIDQNKLGILVAWYLDGRLPEDLVWNVPITAEGIRRAIGSAPSHTTNKEKHG